MIIHFKDENDVSKQFVSHDATLYIKGVRVPLDLNNYAHREAVVRRGVGIQPHRGGHYWIPPHRILRIDL